MKKIIKWIIYRLAIFCSFILIRLSKIYEIRIGRITVERLGHFSIEPEIYLCELDKGIRKLNRGLTILYYTQPICNQFLFKKWKKYFPIINAVVNRIMRFSSKCYVESDRNTLH